MRIAEILAIDIGTSLPPDCSMILIKQQVKASKVVEYLKTDTAHRIVDLLPRSRRVPARVRPRSQRVVVSIAQGHDASQRQEFSPTIPDTLNEEARC